MMHYILPENRDQIEWTSLDSQVNMDNPVRLIDFIIDSIISDNAEQFRIKGQSNSGRKAFSPSTMLKLYLYGYLNKVTSSRRVERECCINVELKWLIGNLTPDYKTIGNFRRENAEAIRTVKVEFRKMLARLKLIKGELIAIDGTKVKANASASTYSLAVIDSLLRSSEQSLEEYLRLVQLTDLQDDSSSRVELSAQEIDEQVDKLQQEMNRLRALREQVLKLGVDEINPTDPESRIMRNHGRREAAYNVQLGVDEANRLIVADEVTSDCNDLFGMAPVLDNLKEEMGTEPRQVLMDMGYNNVEELKRAREERGSELFVSVDSLSVSRKGDPRLSKWAFTYNAENDSYTCPMGHILHRQGNAGKLKKRKASKYYCPKSVCDACPCHSDCVKGRGGRTVMRYTDESWVSEFRAKMLSAPAIALLKRRKTIIEHVFGTLKRWMGCHPLLLRGIDKVRTEISLYTIAYNLRRIQSLGITADMLKTAS